MDVCAFSAVYSGRGSLVLGDFFGAKRPVMSLCCPGFFEAARIATCLLSCLAYKLGSLAKLESS